MDILDYIFRYVMCADNAENYVLFVTEKLHTRMVEKWRSEVVLSNPPKEPAVETFCGHPIQVVDGDGEMFWFAEQFPGHARDLSYEPFPYHAEFICSRCGLWLAEIVGGNDYDGGGFDYCPRCGRKIIR